MYCYEVPYIVIYHEIFYKDMWGIFRHEKN